MLSSSVLSLALLLGTPSETPRLSGGFIQFWGSMKSPESMSEAQWQRFLQAMSDAKMRIIITQWSAYGSTTFVPRSDEFFDVTGALLRYAEKHDMDVYIGLRDDKDWWTGWKDKAYLDKLAEDTGRLAEEIHARYGRSPAFRGWYVPQEMSNLAYDDAQLKNLSAYFRKVSAKCHELAPGKPVAISPFFNPRIEGQKWLVSASENGRNYRRFLENSGLDIVLLQDGAGARGIKKEEIGERIVPYFRELRKACDATHVQLWANAESFEIVPGQPDPQKFWPTDIDRLLEQIRQEAPYVDGRLITFDLFHYMNPYGDLHDGEANVTFRKREKALYDAYKSRFSSGQKQNK